MTKLAILILISACTSNSYAKSYLGYSTIDTEYLSIEYDRSYESNKNALTQWKFAYKDKGLFEFVAGADLDENNEVTDYVLGIGLKDRVIRIETTTISGNIISDDDGYVGSFDNKFKRIDLFKRDPYVDGYLSGFSYQKYAAPYLFKYNDGTTGGIHIQDDAYEIEGFGWGVLYDPIYNLLMSDEKGEELDWYFSTSTMPFSLGRSTTSDAPELSALGMDGKSFWLWGTAGTYEFGWFYSYKTKYVSVVANVGYHLRANVWNNLDLSALYATEAPSNDISHTIAVMVLHGVTTGLSISF